MTTCPQAAERVILHIADSQDSGLRFASGNCVLCCGVIDVRIADTGVAATDIRFAIFSGMQFLRS